MAARTVSLERRRRWIGSCWVMAMSLCAGTAAVTAFAGPGQDTCLVAGPYGTRGAARVTARRLHRQGIAARITKRPTLVVMYRVKLGGFPDPEKAEEAARRLRRDGMHDLEVRVPAGRRGSAWISLGVFRELSDALRRHEQIVVLGFHPHITEEYVNGSRWYLQVPAPADATAFAAAARTRVRPADCTSVGGRSR